MLITFHDPQKLIKRISKKSPKAKDLLLWVFGDSPWIIELNGDVSAAQFNKARADYIKKNPGSKKKIDGAIVWIRTGTASFKVRKS